MGTHSTGISMSMAETDRLKTIQMVIDRMSGVAQAALRLGVTPRQVARLLERYRREGPAGLVSKKRGKRSNHQLADGIAGRAIALIRQRYADFGPTLACEKLRECHGVLGKETVRLLMIKAGLWTPRRQRAVKVYQPRNRRACLGELIQIDGSDHAWFEDRGPACTLLVFIDDATSRLMQLHFAPTESAMAYFQATRRYLEQHGKPVAFYSDKASIFRTTKDSTDFGHGVTQFGRVLYELNIDIWCANSSQAKGRVERANLTLQDRLVKELRLRGVDTIDEGNAFAPQFQMDFNTRFAKSAKSEFDAHRPVRDDEDLDLIFTWRVQRKVSQSLTLQHDRVIYLLADTPSNKELIHRYIDVLEYPDGRIELHADGVNLPYERYDRLSQIDNAAVVENKRLGHALQVAQALQSQRDNRHRSNTPSRTHNGAAPHPRRAEAGKRQPRAFTDRDMEAAVREAYAPAEMDTPSLPQSPRQDDLPPVGVMRGGRHAAGG